MMASFAATICSWALYTRLQAYVALRCVLYQARPTSHEIKF